MGCSEKINTHLSSLPRKLTSVMDFHRQRFSQLNPRFKQQQEQTTTTLLQPTQQPVICPTILPSTARPQPRQQPRTKQYQQPHFPPTQSNRRSYTARVKQQQSADPNREYLTLANLTKILHVLQTQVDMNDSETSTDASASTTNSAKQRVQQHLQDTATRWWKPIRSSDGQLPAPSSRNTYATSATPTQLPSSVVNQRQRRRQSNNLPLIVL